MTDIRVEIHVLKTQPETVYAELAKALTPFRERKEGSVEFVVEGTKENPEIAIRYPGRKLTRIKTIRKNAATYGNLLDFEVVYYKNGKQVTDMNFNYGNFLKDFNEHKLKNNEFWKCIEQTYLKNIIPEKIPHTEGMDGRQFLVMLKWMWIQEDLNYKFGAADIDSPVKYVLMTKSGSRVSKGAGRAKFFGALVLLRNGFSIDEVRRIVPLYN